MPELPEVEIQVRALRRALRGCRLRAVRVHDPKLAAARRLAGRTIRNVRRRGKYIIFDLDDGTHLLVHLRMTGWFESERPERCRVELETARGTVYFGDDRRFSRWELVSAAALRDRLASLGPEPLGRGDRLAGLARTARPVKAALLDQKLIAGVGNIYASESLWHARIHPLQPACRLRLAERRRLQRALAAALRQAIGYGPRIFAVQQFVVYGRAGEPCRRCRTPIRRFDLAGRGTWYCPQCQRRCTGRRRRGALRAGGSRSLATSRFSGLHSGRALATVTAFGWLGIT